MASLISPLEEIDVGGSDLSELQLSEMPYAIDGIPSREDSSGELASFPKLPTTRRPFAEALVQPTPLLPDSPPSDTPDRLDIANRAQDWNIDLPLKYAQPQTGLQVEAVARQPLQTPAQATSGSLSWAASPGERPMSENGMRAQQARSRNPSETQPSIPQAASAEPTQNYQATPPPQPRPRKRFFVYEPAG
ncbi:hypothetical protein Poly24_15540 [Rosistilla carotiformis]|uniref:Uncharacterized protein n=1 Tax=Rosistilla carotiformis TaxID=2528017 RepID=A0A518JQM1_9BACT|nr:hypothetical protein Poly24_15540 [Rosistilla carotiformis]